MDGLLSLLVLAGLFLLMMRFGCGAHVMHGGHGHGHDSSTDRGKTDHRDPVCGMKVDPNAGYGMMHAGQLYRFCSRDCMDKFEADPERYAVRKHLENRS